jgi:hypothetical protein
MAGDRRRLGRRGARRQCADGGSNSQIALQPVSVEAMEPNLAAGIASLT